MTVPSSVAKSGPYLCNGVTDVFNYDFRIVDKSHLNVILANASGVETTLDLTTHYTVSDVGADVGTINLTSAGVALAVTGTTLTILRNPPFTQETDLQNQGAYLAQTVEDRFDLLTMQVQTVKERSDRSIAIPASDESTTLDDLQADLITVAAIAPAVSTVAANDADVSTVAGISADVTTVAGVAADIPTVADVASDIPAVAGIASSIPTVADNVTDITNFSDVYLGPKATAPTLRNDGSALQKGDLYFDTVSDKQLSYTGSSWVGGTGDMLAANNLSDVADKSAAFDELLPDGSGRLTTAKIADGAVTKEKVSSGILLLITAQVASVAALKMLDTSHYNVAYLRGAARGGVFYLDDKTAWTSLISVDLNEGLVIASSDDITKCWVRDVRDPWWSRWFSIPEDTARNGSGADSAPAFNAMMACANLERPSDIRLAPAYFNFESAITSPTYVFGLSGSKGGNNSAGPPTILNKKFVAANGTDALLPTTHYAFDISGIAFTATSGAKGCYISIVNTQSHIGEPRLSKCSLNGYATIDYTFVVNGTGNTTGAPGARNLFVDSCSFFNGQAGSLFLSGVNNAHFGNCQVFNAGGTGLQQVFVNGTAAVPSAHIVMEGVILGVLGLDRSTYFSLAGHVTGQVQNTSNSFNTTIMRATGGVQANWGASNKVLATT